MNYAAARCMEQYLECYTANRKRNMVRESIDLQSSIADSNRIASELFVPQGLSWAQQRCLEQQLEVEQVNNVEQASREHLIKTKGTTYRDELAMMSLLHNAAVMIENDGDMKQESLNTYLRHMKKKREGSKIHNRRKKCVNYSRELDQYFEMYCLDGVCWTK